MTLRRRTSLRASRGTTWSPSVRAAAYAIQPGCIGPLAGMPGVCIGGLELDHIRASGALSIKSEDEVRNAARLCVAHHQLKGREGRKWRPRLIDVVDELMGGHRTHVDPVAGCEPCYQAARR